MLTQTLRTGSPGVICNTNTGPSEYTDSPVASAKAAREQAEETERAVMQQQDQADSLQAAKDASREAKARSKSAFGEKPNTASGKQAHQTAAMAHQDTAKAYTVCAGANSGNELDVRATAKKKADQHTDMAKKHAAIGEGNTMLTRTMNTGCKTVVVNVWSDAAREASAEARSGGDNESDVEKLKPQWENQARGMSTKGLKNRISSSQGKPNGHPQHLHPMARDVMQKEVEQRQAGKKSNSIGGGSGGKTPREQQTSLAVGDRVKGYSGKVPKTTMGNPIGTVQATSSGKASVKWDQGGAATTHKHSDLKRL